MKEGLPAITEVLLQNMVMLTVFFKTQTTPSPLKNSTRKPFQGGLTVAVESVSWVGQLFYMLTKLGQSLLGEEAGSPLSGRYFETFSIPKPIKSNYSVESNFIAKSDPQIMKSSLEQLENKDLQ